MHARFISKIRSKIDWTETKSMIREGIPYLLWTIFGIVYYRIDSVMLSFLTPEAVVGWYGASYKFFDVLAFLPGIYSLSILPVLSKMWGKEDAHARADNTKKSPIYYDCRNPHQHFDISPWRTNHKILFRIA